MLKQVDDQWIRGELLNFQDKGPVSPGSLTHCYFVTSKINGTLLGSVKWFAQWRQFCFYSFGSMFEKKSLREVAEFLEMMTNAHRERRKPR